MAPRIQWAVDLVARIDIVPRLEDELIDELFYQEDEIGEMRHSAFMIECGLEEDPPDGPDVPPVPWGDMLLKQQQQQQEEKVENHAATTNDEAAAIKSSRDDELKNVSYDGKGKRELPARSRSTDDIDILAVELTSKQTSQYKPKLPPGRTNSAPLDLAGKSPYTQYSSNVRRPEKRVPLKTSSDHDIEERKGKASSKRSVPTNRRLTKTSSGSCREMANAVAKARAKIKAEKNGKNSEPTRRLTKTTSGTCHEMATAAAKARKKLNAEKAKKKSQNSVQPASPAPSRRNSIEVSSPTLLSPSGRRRNSIESIAIKNTEKKGRPAPLIRSLVATKSGTQHGKKKLRDYDEESNNNENAEGDDNGASRIVYKNGKRTVMRRNSSLNKDRLSRLKSKSSDSGSERNSGRTGVTRQYSNRSDSSVSDDEILADIVTDSDDDANYRSDYSISTCGSEDTDSQDEPYADVPKAFQQSLQVPIRRRSLIIDSNHSAISRNSSRSTDRDTSKKTKKKKKKKQSGDVDDDSKHSLNDSGTSYLSPSPSSIKTPRKRLSSKKSQSEPQNDRDLQDSISSPIVRERRRSSGCYASPASTKVNRKRLSIKKTSPSEPQKDDGPPPAPSIIEIDQRQSQPVRYLSTPDKIPRKKLSIQKDESEKQGDSNRSSESLVPPAFRQRRSSASFGSPRPDDWLGSGKKPVRSWRVKTKTES